MRADAVFFLIAASAHDLLNSVQLEDFCGESNQKQEKETNARNEEAGVAFFLAAAA